MTVDTYSADPLPPNPGLNPAVTCVSLWYCRDKSPGQNCSAAVESHAEQPYIDLCLIMHLNSAIFNVTIITLHAS